MSLRRVPALAIATWLVAGSTLAATACSGGDRAPHAVATNLAGRPAAERSAGVPSGIGLCAGVDSILRALVAAHPPADSAHATTLHGPDTLTFHYQWARTSAPGCRVAAEGTDSVSHRGVIGGLDSALTTAGWRAVDSLYMADGPDGSMRGFVRGAVLCLREETWDGGDDSDSTYVPAPDFTAGFRCAPHRADDVPPA
ncbi:MAG TPA: hypothetical protein VMV51_15885 [Gemmatimonadaceae bacterium]|nr:hypothetical protein [Gemmatimonadaceae bacterium]